MKKILILLIALSFAVFGCSHKKKGILLPFLTLLNQDAGASTAKSESSAGTATASNGGSVVIVDNTGSGNNSSGVLLPNNNSDSSSNATTNSQTSGNNSSSAGSSNNSSSSGSNSNSGSNNSNSNSGSTSVGSNSDSGSSSGSNTGSSSSSEGDTNTNSGSTNVGSNSDSGSSGSNAGSGSSSGSDTSTNSGGTNVGSNSDSGSSGSNAGSSSSSGSDTNTGTGSNNGSSNPSTPSQEITGVITVNDQIGIPDTLDTYPQDPTRSSLIRIPAEGVSTVAYEDLYPSAEDADLNDYVLHIHNEEDLNAAGDVIRLRGTYQHVARGAGYKHTFFLKLPVAVGATFSRKVVREDGKIVTDLTTKTVSSSDLNLGIQIHEESNKTTSNPNVNPGGVYKPGYIATIEIVFNSPVKKTALGSYPYDIFIKVINTGKEIHFPGLYKNANGTDKYLDSNNFPWAILVPGAWKYPYEGLDIRKDTQTGYKEFNLWVASNGTSYKDWYKHITNQAKVFPVPDEDSELMGFLLRSMKKNAILIAILLIGAGAAVAYILKRRTLSQA
ncbi:putative lipoprotein [Leptospira interrogans serovar Valbuzzi str. Duyster]|uniref:LruC domain-containing protein n=1 Tax=Leptospira interrogans TaxID=173 RepID=UPI0002BED392|nr:LruC domain-containing protein [Leptospira interrogans]EMJ56820.1 putative lipoprotein [Leptospira interrogans serovar Valbuzzi str. Duyster]